MLRQATPARVPAADGGSARQQAFSMETYRSLRTKLALARARPRRRACAALGKKSSAGHRSRTRYGLPFGSAVRTDAHIATLIQALEPYTPIAPPRSFEGHVPHGPLSRAWWMAARRGAWSRSRADQPVPVTPGEDPRQRRPHALVRRERHRRGGPADRQARDRRRPPPREPVARRGWWSTRGAWRSMGGCGSRRATGRRCWRSIRERSRRRRLLPAGFEQAALRAEPATTSAPACTSGRTEWLGLHSPAEVERGYKPKVLAAARRARGRRQGAPALPSGRPRSRCERRSTAASFR